MFDKIKSIDMYEDEDHAKILERVTAFLLAIESKSMLSNQNKLETAWAIPQTFSAKFTCVVCEGVVQNAKTCKICKILVCSHCCKKAKECPKSKVKSHVFEEIFELDKNKIRNI